ncbi:hypothetical protein [Streptomyces sp. SID14515]|uniref:hypothetical protein n=1 Tax=Streptomyces sp. SID14515 TaxID=2706074 RepID=UPI0013CB4856|nr:hypothetical protein [Streptomyces sp. SID14515]NEB36412.1 hypothetical protein [Streptomyces sp. SID14515]
MVVGAVVALALAGGGTLYATKGGWLDDRSLASACDGLLDTSEVKELLGADRLRGEGTETARCTAVDPDDGKAALQVQISRGEAPRTVLGTMARANPHIGGASVTPAGAGRPVVLGAQPGTASGSVSCAKGDGGSVTVLMRASRKDAGKLLGEPEERARLARVLTSTLERAAERWGCEKPVESEGGKVGEVPANTSRALRQAGKATGTCAGIDSASYETPTDDAAPIEDCELAEPSGTRLFQLSAYYGPYVKAARQETIRGKQLLTDVGGGGGLWWTTADCPQGDVLYTVETVWDEEKNTFHPPSPKLQKDALKTFAERSAERHGCSTPEPLPTNDGTSRS